MSAFIVHNNAMKTLRILLLCGSLAFQLPALAAAQTPDLKSALLAMQVTLPDSSLKLARPMSCTSFTGAVVMRCVTSFTDTQRFGKLAYVAIYALADPSAAVTLQNLVDANLSKLTATEATTVPITLADAAGKITFQSQAVCKQASRGLEKSYAVCLAKGSGDTVVATAVFPGSLAPLDSTSTPPDVGRAITLETQALLAVYNAIDPAAN